MLKNLFKYSFRALSRQKSYVFINILGLSIGIACSLIISLFIIHELSYDQFNEKKDRIYRVILNGKINGQELKVTSTAAIIGPTVLNEFPEVEDFLRMDGSGELVVSYKDKNFSEKEFLEADSSFFNFFSIPLIRGNKNTVLNKTYTAVITQKVATKIFGDEDPIDKMLKIGSDTTRYRVTGIMEEIPENAHFRANIIGSFMTNHRSNSKEWMSNSFNTYLLLHPNAKAQDVDEHFKDLVIKYCGPEVIKYLGITIEEFFSQGNKYNLYLQNLCDVHLDPSIEQMLKPANDPKYLWIFAAIAILIIIIAAINFMNLSTAQAGKRAKEVGIKKVCGSSRPMLVKQFLLESMLLSFFALVLAILITELSLPYFNELMNLEISAAYFSSWFTIPSLLILTILIGFLAGSYPAFYLSAFNPYMVLKGKLRSGRQKSKLRSGLVILQFAISIVLITGTLIMFRQIEFMQNKELGFDKENVMVIRRAHIIGQKIESFKDALKQIPGVIQVSASTALPGHNNNNNGYRMKGRPEESFLLQTNWVDCDYLETHGYQLADGRFFDKAMLTDENTCLINETAVKIFNLENPLTEAFENEDEAGDLIHTSIIGVLKDFHYESLRSEIQPYVMRFKNKDINWGYISVKLSPNSIANTVDEIENTWASFTNNNPIKFFFVDKDLERLYTEEKRNATLSILFTILGILIAALGLYGLTAFSVQQRTKEIGVRKAFGAAIGNIWYLIAREIIVLVLIATAIAWPLIYWVADNWLQNYQYRIKLDIFDFMTGFLIAIVIALMTISYRAIKAARANPIESLRYE
jgi:putative ABC transport system permease protein